MIDIALGFDLALNTGWSIVRWRGQGHQPTVLACGNVSVAAVDGTSARLQAWAAQVGGVVGQAQDAGVSAAAYEEIRRATGHGAVYIAMMEGLLLGHLATLRGGLAVLGVPQSTLRAFAGLRPKGRSNPRPKSWARAAMDTFVNPSMLYTEDQAVASFAAYWLCRKGLVVKK